MKERFRHPAKEIQKHPHFFDAVVDLAIAHRIDIAPKTIAMVFEGGTRIKHSKDVSHDEDHYLQMVKDTKNLLHTYPDLRDHVDWDIYLCTLSFHDAWVSSLEPGLCNLVAAQFFEHKYADTSAVEYMKASGFTQKQIDQVAKLIHIHPLAFDHTERQRVEKDMDDKVKFTGRLFYVIDTWAVFDPKRIDDSVTHAKHSLGESAAYYLSPVLALYYKKNNTEPLHLGSDFPGIAEETDRRRSAAHQYIDNLLQKKLI